MVARPLLLLGMLCSWGHYQDAEAFPMSTAPIPMTKTYLVSPLHWCCPCLDTAHHPWVTDCTEVAILPLPAQCQNLHAAKSMEMCLKLRSGNLVGPWRDLVLSIPLLVPEKWFKVLWLPLYSASSAAQPPVPSWHQNSLNFGHHRGWGWLCPCWCIHPHTVQELFPLNDTPSWRISAPGVKVNPG